MTGWPAYILIVIAFVAVNLKIRTPPSAWLKPKPKTKKRDP